MNSLIHRNRKAGFSLIEVMLALAVFGVAIGGLIGIMSATTRNTGETLERTAAVNFMKFVTSEVTRRAASEPSLSLAGIIPSTFPAVMTRDGSEFAFGSSSVSGPFAAFFEASIASGPTALATTNYTSAVPVAYRVEIEVVWPANAPSAQQSSIRTHHVFTR